MNSETIVESVKFLLKSVQQLSDRFVASNQGISLTIEKLVKRIGKIEDQLENMRDEYLLGSTMTRRPPELPVSESSRSRLVHILNVAEDSVMDIYRNTPALLEPFARPCSLSAKTLSGEIDKIELEAFAQGSTWIIELQNGAWVIVPRPGSLQRQTQIDGLAQIFKLDFQGELPANIDMLTFATATVIEHGVRWHLKDKGQIGVHTDPLSQSLENRLRDIEQKIDLIQNSTVDQSNE